MDYCNNGKERGKDTMIILEQRVLREFITHEGKTFRLADYLPRSRYNEEQAVHFSTCMSTAGNEVIMVKTPKEYAYYINQKQPIT